MPFVRQFHTLLQKSNQNIIIKNLDDSIEMQNFDTNFDLISTKKILDGKYSFVDVYFDINEDDTIYGIINVQKNSLIHLYINDKVIIENTLLKYYSNLFTIQFPFIKSINSNTHVIYYLINNYNMNKATLIHYYKEKDSWIKNEIDLLDYNILTNYVVIFENSTPIIFYFKIINGYEEIFYSTFNLTNKSWSNPIQITNSNKFKVYLSAIRCNNGRYHIVYSENNFNKYYCKYINIYFTENIITILNDKIIGKTSACTFPNILHYNEFFSIQWIENHTLYYSISYDFGETWSKPTLDKNSYDYSFNYYIHKSNNFSNKQFNCAAIFLYDNSLNILGITNN